MKGVPVLVLANKQDLAVAMDPDDLADGLALAGVLGRAWSVMPCSAKTGQGMREGLAWLADQTVARRRCQVDAPATGVGGGGVVAGAVRAAKAK